VVTITAFSWPSQSVSMQPNIIDHRRVQLIINDYGFSGGAPRQTLTWC
jgi:hypothetical protein